MENGILDQIGFRPNLELLAKKLRLKPGSRYLPELEKLVKEARAVARPKAAFRVGYIENKNHQTVQINGITFNSRVLRVNLEEAHRVFIYLATCGVELEEWSKSVTDLLQQYWADTIKEQALRSASRALDRYLKEQFQLSKTSAMAPGSLEAWPITEQRQLFDLMGGLDREIGVQLTDSYLMLPIKTISGVRFPTENRFESCQLCPRENCPGRRSPYDRDLYEKRFA
jgi:hypothetical protein